MVRTELSHEWPPGYLDEVLGCTQDDPISRPDQRSFQGRDALA
ncbi:MAG: hypothetical protein AB1758_35670 [Candidatus Eremiobacterota bacterium]